MSTARLPISDIIEVKQNLHIVARERGKIVTRRDGHNIWLNLGREYLSQLIAYKAFSPDETERDDRIRYMGFGVGGTRQVAPLVANADPIGGVTGAYPGTNVQTDLDPTVIWLERPVRLSGGSTTYPGVVGDVWIGQIQAPATHDTVTSVTFKRLFPAAEVSYAPFLSVPLSEVGLFTSAADPGVYRNNPVAYDTFDTISKTNAVEIEIDWTIRF
jgi:hypothetical protein